MKDEIFLTIKITGGTRRLFLPPENAPTYKPTPLSALKPQSTNPSPPTYIPTPTSRLSATPSPFTADSDDSSDFIPVPLYNGDPSTEYNYVPTPKTSTPKKTSFEPEGSSSSGASATAYVPTAPFVLPQSTEASGRPTHFGLMSL